MSVVVRNGEPSTDVRSRLKRAVEFGGVTGGARRRRRLGVGVEGGEDEENAREFMARSDKNS